MKESFQRLRLQEFNKFDIERLLKNNIDFLEKENEDITSFLEDNVDILDEQTVKDMAETVQNNAAEIVHVSSVLTHTDNIYSYFSQGPLFRKDRDAT